MFTRSTSFLPLAGLMLTSVHQTLAQTCESYGIDFVNGGSYFINTNSNVDFTCVTQFSGCQNDTANIIITDPNDNEYYCTDVPLQPDYTSEMSTCPIEKSQMVTGEYELTIISNNGNGDPIAYQRDFSITAGPQQTVTVTPTLRFNYTSTPTVTSTTTNVFTSSVTVNNTQTITIPAATLVKTVTPSPTTVTSTTTLTRTFKTWTRTAIVVTSTITASCTVPPRPACADPTWHSRPQILAVLPSGLSNPYHKREALLEIRDNLRKERRSGRLAERNCGADKRNLAKRSADAPTVTTTETTATATTTSTFIGTTSTVLDIETATTTITSTLPPATTHYGTAYSTTTLPQKTSTKLQVTTTYTWQVATFTASLTHWSTVTPTASVTACKKQGGHFGPIWW